MAASASTLVEKATSDLLISPDWGMNLEICDMINHNPWQAREVVKTIKKRLGHKSGRVQLLALTVLETVMKNCGEVVHRNVAEKEVLNDMVKIVRKKFDMAVRNKILVLLDSWQVAFGGPSSKYPQYYIAYDNLRRAGVEFPERTADAVPIFTPPPNNQAQTYQHAVYGPFPQLYPPHGAPPSLSYGSPPYQSAASDAVASTPPMWGSKDMDAAQTGLHILNEMLNAVDPHCRQALKDDVIIQLVEQCRSYQKSILQLVNSTSDESLLRQGLALNDDLEHALTKHDAIASGCPLASETNSRGSPRTFISYDYEDEDAEDELSQLDHRQSSRPDRASGEQETQSSGATQFALPPPPQPIRNPPPQPIRNINSSMQVQGGLLGGEVMNYMPPRTPGTSASPVSQRTSSLTEHEDFVNPFADSSRFVATPPLQAQKQTHSLAVASSPLNSYQPSSPSPQQSSPSVYGSPWVSKTVPGAQQPSSLNSYNWKAEGRQGGQSSSPWESASSTNSTPSIPPPPMLLTERSHYLHEQTNFSAQRSLSGESTGLKQQALNLSLKDNSNRQVQNASIGNLSHGSRFPGSQTPSKASRASFEHSDKWFGDLVDFSSVGSSFKKTGLTSSLTRTNTSKASET